jgi:N-acetylneuraminic acid mutarotase
MPFYLMRRIALLLAALSVASCNETNAPETTEGPSPAEPTLAVASNTWINRAPMPVGRDDPTTAMVVNRSGQSILYAMGGRTGLGSVGRVDAYNVATNTWTRKAQMPVSVFQTNGAGVINGKIYVSGGWINFSRPVADLLMYDPATNTWTKKRPMPITSANGVTGVIDNRLYVVTGCGIDACDQPQVAGLFRYDPATDQWTSLPNPHRLDGGVGGTIGKKLYVLTTVINSQGFFVYDPMTNRWSTRTPLPGCWSAAGATLAAKLYVFGGLRCNPDGTTSAVRNTSVYDPVTDTWTAKAPMPSVRGGIAASRVILNGQSRIEVVGGIPPNNNQAYIP